MEGRVGQLARVAGGDLLDRAVGPDEVDDVDVLGMGIDDPREAAEAAARRVLGDLVLLDQDAVVGLERVGPDLVDDLDGVVEEVRVARAVQAVRDGLGGRMRAFERARQGHAGAVGAGRADRRDLPTLTVGRRPDRDVDADDDVGDAARP